MSFSNPIRPPVGILKNDNFGSRNLGGKVANHGGVDLRPVSDDILASHSGQVTFAGKDQYGGLYIDITNGNQKTRYLHNRQNLVTQGQSIEAGQIIGYIGKTGKVTGRHLHFETWVDGKRVDPKSVVDFNSQPYTKPQPAPLPAPIQPATPQIPKPPLKPQPEKYIVKPGDTLSELVAKHYNIKSWIKIRSKYLEVAKYNSIEDPGKIKVNQVILLP
jgi:murein DD-endopeptidase MepM/ murein hydrolase activator NlpD